MRDLLKLASDHRIEEKLYCGEGIDRIYQLMGDDRLTKWLTYSCTHIAEKELSDEQIWFRHLCNANDHVCTDGPNGSKLVPYFSCKRFVEINPCERYMLVKEKGFCKQCLFLGADQEKGKHKEGKCQRDFICPDLAHNAHTVKKDVLICHEHRSSRQNQDLLKKYKERFIDRRVELPSYSKKIKLTFLAQNFKADGKGTSKECNSKCNDEAMYLLQNILFDGVEHSINSIAINLYRNMMQ